MSMLPLLKKHNIVLPAEVFLTDERKQQFKTDCPQSYCKKTREAGDTTPLTVELILPGFAEWRCSHCLWSDHIGERPHEVSEVVDGVEVTTPPPAPRELPAEAVEFLEAHGISEITATKYKLGYDGRRKAIKIPYFDGPNIINHEYVYIADGDMKMERPDATTFYGLPQMEIGEGTVTIAQRALDAIVLMELGIPAVIALPNGGDVMDKADDFNREPDSFGYMSRAAAAALGWLNVRFAFDATKRGLALRQELSRRLGPGKCLEAKLARESVWQTVVALGSDAVCEDIKEAQPLPILGLFSVDDFEHELKAYFEYGMSSGVSTGWKNVDKLYTVVPGQLTVITGIPNSGKSEWVDALTFNLALNEGWRFAAFSPENGKEAHTMKLVEKRVEMTSDPKSKERMSYDTMMSGARWVSNHYCFIESRDVIPTLDWILERATDAVLRHGIKGLIIDPWNRIEKKLAGKSETDFVAESLPRILRFAANQGVHVWLVVHPKQQQPDPKTGKIRAPSLYDMAGSAHFVNMCDNGVVIHRSDSIDDTTEVLIRKVRFKHVGRRGETKLSYNIRTGRYEPLDEEYSPAMAEAMKKAAPVDKIKTYEVD